MARDQIAHVAIDAVPRQRGFERVSEAVEHLAPISDPDLGLERAQEPAVDSVLWLPVGEQLRPIGFAQPLDVVEQAQLDQCGMHRHEAPRPHVLGLLPLG